MHSKGLLSWPTALRTILGTNCHYALRRSFISGQCWVPQVYWFNQYELFYYSTVMSRLCTISIISVPFSPNVQLIPGEQSCISTYSEIWAFQLVKIECHMLPAKQGVAACALFLKRQCQKQSATPQVPLQLPLLLLNNPGSLWFSESRSRSGYSVSVRSLPLCGQQRSPKGFHLQFSWRSYSGTKDHISALTMQKAV